MVGAFYQAEFFLAQVMIQAIKLKIRPRAWLSFQDPTFMEEKEKLFDRATTACQHKNLRRSGNRHGHYSQCTDCGKRWTWKDAMGQWTEPAAKTSAPWPLPSPSSSTATTFLDARFTPAERMGLENWNLTMEHKETMPSSQKKSIAPAPKRGLAPKSLGTATRKKRNNVDKAGDSDDFDWALVT